MESEYIGLFNCANQSQWFSDLLNQLSHPLPYKQLILCNNQSAIHIANGEAMAFKRSRYMNVKYHWVRDTGGKGWCPELVHHKYITRKWTKYQANTHPAHPKFIQNFPSQFSCNFPSTGNGQYIQCSRSCDWDFPVRKILGTF